MQTTASESEYARGFVAGWKAAWLAAFFALWRRQ